MKKFSADNKLHFERRSIYQIKRLKSKSSNKRGGSSIGTFYIDLIAPENLKLQYEYCNEVVDYINRVKRVGRSGKNIFIRLDRVLEIGEGAIAMLLSVIEGLGENGIRVKGNKPRVKEARDILEKSGFFDFVKGKIESKNESTKNTILKTGDKDTPQSTLSVEIRKAMESVWGVQGRNPIVYGAAFEMMRNSCDHAFRKENQIKWHFAISHDEQNNKVKFSFVDNGKGIVDTFKFGFLKSFITFFKDNTDLLETAFKNGIESRTGLKWRGKGLPTIYEAYEDSYIKNLLVISNDVFIHFDRNIKNNLDYPFSGTYYYWEIDTSCTKACFN